MDNETLAYIAGVMDADGWFTIKRATYAIRVIKDSKNPTYAERVGIKQTSNEATQLIYDNFGGYYRIEKPTAINGKPLYALQITHLKAHRFIKAILPYLRIKKRQAEVLIKLRDSINEGKQFRSVPHNYIEYRESLIKEIERLNDTRPYQKAKTIAW